MLLLAINEVLLLSLVQTLHVSVVLEIGAWCLRTTRTAPVVVAHWPALATGIVSRPRGIVLTLVLISALVTI